ncbi:amino acid adenylation domain-containing protein [Nonomuraea mangrovi]|uniref:Amino acid adenylation domain-containing protein n=1 Tax=Nonomuraea mangrovi TaxID=2316207 RepID=A0ABW4T1L9_9ACTN
MNRDAVAIIGVALSLPGADDLDALHDGLGAGHSRLCEPADERVRHAGGDVGTAYVPGGYLDRIDLFDHRFFGISRREAELMDPHQRLTIQLVHRAVENAGYATRSLRGTRTAVVLSAPRPEYATLFSEDDPQQILGTLPAATAARVAYLLDLAGPVLAVDTACSGSLAALADAVGQLRAGRADLAIAGGLSVQALLRPAAQYDPLPGIESPSGVCRPFDADADGTVGGEGGGFVLLKPLAAAVADGDHVHAVLRGVAVNHNGYRATALSAPSQDAQSELLTAAWRDAGLSVSDAGYIECHGSGTPLGDLVEVGGLRQALEGAGRTVLIGGAKGNVGHLDHASGMAGLFRVLAGLRHATLYPTAGFRTPHPSLVPEEPVRVSVDRQPWPSAPDGGPRRAGVSSFGLTGTNVHAVVEEQSRPRPRSDRVRPAAELVTLSAASPEAYVRYARSLGEFLKTTDDDLATVAHALNRGRDDHPWRRAFAVRDLPEFADALLGAQPPTQPVPDRAPPLVLLFSGDGDIGDTATGDALWHTLRKDFPALADEEDRLFGAGDRGAQVLLRRHLALYGLARSLGLDTGRLVGSGPGNLAVQVIRGQISPEDAWRDATHLERTADVDDAGLRRAVRDFDRDGVLLLELGSDGVLSRRIRELAPELTVLPFLSGGCVLDALARLYEQGATIDWDRHYEGAGIRRTEVPTYPFEPDSCWYRPPEDTTVTASGPAPDAADAAEIRRGVADIWSHILKAPDIGPDSDYFALGGSSIAGITFLRESESRFGVRPTFADLYEHRTVREMAGLIAARLTAPGETPADGRIARLPAGARIPLSYNQEQLWYLDRLASPGPLYNIPGDLRHRGPLDHEALRAALLDVVARHEVLRTRVLDDMGRPYVLFDAPAPALTVVDLRGSVDPETEARRLAHDEAIAPFDLSSGPLLRTTLLQVADDEHILLCTWHHIVFDGWSPTVFFRDLGAYYTARLTRQPATLPELTCGYGDFAAWQREVLTGDRLERGLRFWREELADLRTTELPLDRPRPVVETHAGALLPFSLSAEHALALREFSRQEGVTTFVTMLSVVDALLHLWAGQKDVVVGGATSGRSHPDTHEMIGYFNNGLPFRTRVDEDLTFRELVRRCAKTVAGVLDHEEIPFGKIVADLGGRRDPSRHPVFTVSYIHQNTAGHFSAPASLDLAPAGGTIGGVAPGTSKVDLTIGLNDEPDSPMTGYLEYAVDLFDLSTAEQLATFFQDLVGAAVDDPDRRLAELAAKAPERSSDSVLHGQALSVLRGRERPVAPLSVHRAVKRWAASHPDRPAVVDSEAGRTLSYGELDSRAEDLARRLVAAGVTPGTPVPVVAGRGLDLVTGWLGVLKAGGAFVPIDTGLPEARMAELLTGLGNPLAVLGEGQRRPAAIEVIPVAGGRVHEGVLPPDPPPDSLAYIAHTSGTTGRPHGCEVTHGSLGNLLTWYAATTGLGRQDRVAQVLATGLDAAVLETLSALSQGAALHVLHNAARPPADLLRWMAREQITVACLAAPLGEMVLGDLPDVPGLRLRVLSIGGDRLRVRPPAHAPFRTLNHYGPTECAVVATWAEVTPGPADTLPGIGRPVDNCAAYVLRADGRPCAPGEQGELYIGGAAVGRGYHGLPGATAARFVADPFSDRPGARMYRTGDLARLGPDGSLVFEGRGDQQLEIRGYRVEPIEIERVLLEHPGVREAVVLPDTGPRGTVRMAGHVAGEPRLDSGALRGWLAERLPAHMVPSRIIVHDRLPQTPNAKTDRKRMMEMATRPAPLLPAAEGTPDPERTLSLIWADLLGRESVHPHDDFFEIGGDSLLSVAVAARAESAGLSITPQDVLERPRLRDLAAGVLPSPADGPPPPDSSTPIPLTPLMHGMLDRAKDTAKDFVVVEVLEIAAGVRSDAVCHAAATLLDLHEPLRYRVRRNAAGWRIDVGTARPHDVLDVTVLPAMGESAELAVLESDKDELLKDIDPARGAMLRMRFYDRGSARTGLLTLVVHHFAYDHTSAVPLLEDFNAALRDSGPAPRQDPATRAAWSRWSRHLTEMSTSDEVAAEAGYWAAVLEGGRTTGRLPTGLEPSSSPSPPGVLRRVLPADRVAPALATSGTAGRTAATAAVACAWSRWTGRADAYLMLVGEATHNPFRPYGRSRSIGWFTSSYPAVIPVAEGQRADDALASATDYLHAVPNDGVGYGMLRQLSAATPMTERIRALPEPAVLVEHTATGGEALRVGRGDAWIRSVPLMVEHRSLLAWLPVAVSSMLSDGELVIHLAHDGQLPTARMEELADHLADAFAELAGKPEPAGQPDLAGER